MPLIKVDINEVTLSKTKDDLKSRIIISRPYSNKQRHRWLL